MFEDFKQLAIQLDFSISTTKLQLLKALDNLKRSCKNLNEVNEKKLKVLKKTSVRDFIKTMRIPLCITSPSTMKNLENNAKKTMKKKTSLTTTIPDKIEITLRDEKGCIHERFAIIRELAASNLFMKSVILMNRSWCLGRNATKNIRWKQTISKRY